MSRLGQQGTRAARLAEQPIAKWRLEEIRGTDAPRAPARRICYVYDAGAGEHGNDAHERGATCLDSEGRPRASGSMLGGQRRRGGNLRFRVGACDEPSRCHSRECEHDARASRMLQTTMQRQCWGLVWSVAWITLMRERGTQVRKTGDRATGR